MTGSQMLTDLNKGMAHGECAPYCGMTGGTSRPSKNIHTFLNQCLAKTSIFTVNHRARPKPDMI